MAMHDGVPSYGSLVIINSAVFILFCVQLLQAPDEAGLALHPQYVGFVLVMFGFLLQWPTLLTLAMFPVLVFMYVHLVRVEEREALAEFGTAYERYARYAVFHSALRRG